MNNGQKSQVFQKWVGHFNEFRQKECVGLTKSLETKWGIIKHF